MIEGTTDPDNVLRRKAWLEAHPGGKIENVTGENRAQDGWTVTLDGRPFPSEADAERVPWYRHLWQTMDELDGVEVRGQCPVHGIRP